MKKQGPQVDPPYWILINKHVEIRRDFLQTQGKTKISKIVIFTKKCTGGDTATHFLAKVGNYKFLYFFQFAVELY